MLNKRQRKSKPVSSRKLKTTLMNRPKPSLPKSSRRLSKRLLCKLKNWKRKESLLKRDKLKSGKRICQLSVLQPRKKLID